MQIIGGKNSFICLFAHQIHFLILLKKYILYISIGLILHFYFLLTFFDQICLKLANYNNTVLYIFRVSIYIYRNITNLRFADDIDSLAEEEQELEALVESLDKTCTRYKMEISAEKTKLMTNSANGIQREIKVKGQKLGTVTSFKYLGAVVSDDGSKPEVLSRIAQATAALTKLKPIWRDNNISLGSKVKLMRSLVSSIFLYACESWTLSAELEKRTQAFEMRCYRRLLNISYKDHVTNEEVRRKIQAAIGEYDELLTLVKKRKLRWFGHVSRSSGLAKTILQGTVKGKRKRGRQKKRWEDNIKEWTGMDFASSTRAAENRSRWKGVVANSSVVPRRPSKVMG